MAVKPIPDMYHNVQPYLVVDGAAELIEFLKGTFDVESRGVMPRPDGRVGHAEIVLGDSVIMLADAGGPSDAKPTSTMLVVYVEDVADGILLAHDKGRIGESYVIGGQIVTMREALERILRAAGKKVPKRTLPEGVMRLGAPFGPVIGKLTGLPPNFRELLRNAGATFYATDEKARRELGYAPRDLDTGLTETLAAP